MTITSITFAEHAGTVSAIKADGSETEIKTPSGSNQTTTIVATTSRSIARIATDVAVYVSFGTAPNASSDASRWLVPAGGVEYYGVTPGHKASVVTA